MYAWCLNDVWVISESFLDGVSMMSEPCLDDVKKMFAHCLHDFSSILNLLSFLCCLHWYTFIADALCLHWDVVHHKISFSLMFVFLYQESLRAKFYLSYFFAIISPCLFASKPKVQNYNYSPLVHHWLSFGHMVVCRVLWFSDGFARHS